MNISERQITLPATGGIYRSFGSDLGAPILLSLIVFVACLLGIVTRPVGFLATLWPANAVMLGLLVRFPKAAGWPGWLGAGSAYLAADLLTGASIDKAILLNAANMIGVAAGYLVYRNTTTETANLSHSSGMFHLLFASATAGAAAGVIGAVVNPLLFGRGAMEGWSFWFATELVNYVTFLPVILAMSFARRGDARKRPPVAMPGWRDIAPELAVAGSCALAVIGSGPGAIAYPVPALLWCGLNYSILRTAVLTSLFGCWTLVAIAAGILPHDIEPFDEQSLISVRIAVALVSMAPIMLASIMHGRNELLAALKHQATHDNLTGLTNRSAFLEMAENALVTHRRPLAVMMVDIDRFKRINDNHGHAGGDQVLVQFARRVRGCLRSEDMFARMGGEEFAILVTDCSQADAAEIADRILAVVRDAPFPLAGGAPIDVSTSIGLVWCDQDAAGDIDALLAEADAELYQAKQSGRDRVCSRPLS